MDRNDIAAYMMQGVMAQRSISPGTDGETWDYSGIADKAFDIADMLIYAFGSLDEPNLYAVLATQAMVAKVINDGSEFDYDNIISAALDMAAAMNPI